MECNDEDYSEPALAAERYPSPPAGSPKRRPTTGVPAKSVVGITAPGSPTSTHAPSPTHAGELSGSWTRPGSEWLSKHLGDLRDDAAAARLDCEPNPAFPMPPRASRATSPSLDADCPIQLKARIASLEADVRALLDEATSWRHRCFALEKDRAVALEAEDRAQLELREAHDRERALAAQTVELRMHQRDSAETTAERYRLQQQHAQDLREKEAELDRTHGRLQDALVGLGEAESELKAGRSEVAALRSEASVARGEAAEAREALRSRDSEVDSVRLLLRGARSSAKRQDEQLQVKDEAIEDLRRQLSAARANTASYEELQAKDAELARLRQELQDALSCSLARRSAHRGELQTKEAELASARRDMRDARDDASLSRVASQQAQKSLEARESELSGVRAELREAVRDGASARDHLVNARAHVRELEARVKALEAIRSGDAALQRALDTERCENMDLRQRISTLESQLQVANFKEEDLVREAEMFRSRGEHQELVSQKLRLDLQDAMNTDTKMTLKPCATDLLGGFTLQSARTKVPPVPLPPPPLITSARRDYPSSSITRRLRKEVLSARKPTTDRTLASSRYDSRGRLISFDASGRAIP